MQGPAILVAEDEESDVFFLRRALQKAGIENPLVAVSDGRKAIEYLNGDGAYSDRAHYPLPALFLLDLKMPLMTGFDVLDWLQRKPEFRSLPVVVLTSSCHEKDKQRARELGAADYKIKPSNAEELVGMVRELHSRWLASRAKP